MRNVKDLTLNQVFEKLHSRKSGYVVTQEGAWADPAGPTDVDVVGNVAVGRQGIMLNDQDQFQDHLVLNFKIIY